jgi:prolyl-tRNA editing enzyme YbaK/EbsC (Cys-tRNA(Pro) deacylase)
LAALLGAGEIRKATAEEARDATGFAIGGTPPFAHASALRVLVDRDLLSHDLLWAAAGTPDAVFPIRPGELVRSSGGEVADFKAEG